MPETLADRLQTVNERIRNACARARRDPAQVRLLAVTKIFPAEVIRDAYALGLREFGENYVQEMERKAPVLADLADARFHLIGHLQSNKTKRPRSCSLPSTRSMLRNSPPASTPNRNRWKS